MARPRKMDSRRQGVDQARSARKRADAPARNEPIFKVVSKAATDLNDVLNAVALRSALMRGRPPGSSNENDTWRLAGLLERASELVRELQAYVHDIELHNRNLSSRPDGEDEPGH